MRSLSYHPDGSLLASGGTDCAIKLWDTRIQQPAQHYYAHGSTITQLAFHPGGRSLLSASLDGTMRVWDTVAGRALYTMHGQGGAVRAAAFSPEGHFLASGGQDRLVRVWHMQQDYDPELQPRASAAEEGCVGRPEPGEAAVPELQDPAQGAVTPTEARPVPSPTLVHSGNTELSKSPPKVQALQQRQQQQQRSAQEVAADPVTCSIEHMTQRLQQLDKRMAVLGEKVHVSEAMIRRAAGIPA